MQSIWKFEIQPTDEFSISMPKGAKVLCVAVQREIPCLWALVDTASPMELRKFMLRGTGHDATGLDSDQYCGSVFLAEGALVFHLFCINPAPCVPKENP